MVQEIVLPARLPPKRLIKPSSHFTGFCILPKLNRPYGPHPIFPRILSLLPSIAQQSHYKGLALCGDYAIFCIAHYRHPAWAMVLFCLIASGGLWLRLGGSFFRGEKQTGYVSVPLVEPGLRFCDVFSVAQRPTEALISPF